MFRMRRFGNLCSRSIIVLSLISTILCDQFIPENPLTFGNCNALKSQCTGGRKCIFEYRKKLFKCSNSLTTCLCIPPSFQTCTSSFQCLSGERCVSTNSSVTICVACTAAEYVPSFVSVDYRSTMDCFPELLEPTPSPEHTPEPEPSTPNNLDKRGFAYDLCRLDSQCQPEYFCRNYESPLLRCSEDSKENYYCVCKQNDPKPCHHFDDCLSEELCVQPYRMLASSFGICFSKFSLTVLRRGISYSYLPPESNPFLDISIPSTPEIMPSADPDFPDSPDDLEPYLSASPAPTMTLQTDPSPSVLSTLEPSPVVSESPLYGGYIYVPDPKGFTLDRCYRSNRCRGQRFCVDMFFEEADVIRCQNQCYCVPHKLKNCTSSSECRWPEVCAMAQGVNGAFCASLDAVKKSTAFEILPFDDGNYVPKTTPTIDPYFTPFAGSREPVYFPPGYPTSTYISVPPTPETSESSPPLPTVDYPKEIDGLSLSYCSKQEDCVYGYACVSIGFYPCSSDLNDCRCIPNNGDMGTVCMDDSQCSTGEICFRPERIDVVPSYCVSNQTATMKVLRNFMKVISPRGVGYEYRTAFYTDWKIPKKTPPNSGTGNGLTGDKCSTSSQCATGRLCADILGDGEICDDTEDCLSGFCYPMYFERCERVNLCDDGEVCVIAVIPENQFSEVFPSSLRYICLSKAAAERNGYSSVPTPTPPPVELVGYSTWKNAEDILKIKLQWEASKSTRVNTLNAGIKTMDKALHNGQKAERQLEGRISTEGEQVIMRLMNHLSK